MKAAAWQSSDQSILWECPLVIRTPVSPRRVCIFIPFFFPVSSPPRMLNSSIRSSPAESSPASGLAEKNKKIAFPTSMHASDKCLVLHNDTTTQVHSFSKKTSNSSPGTFISGKSFSDIARAHSAIAGDGRFEQQLGVKLASVVTQRKIESSQSSDDRALYLARLQRNHADLAVMALCDQEKASTLALLRGTFSAVWSKRSLRNNKG